MLANLFAQIDGQIGANPDLGPLPAIFGVITLAVVVLMFASYWKIFTKAGQPGWASLIPIYNVLVYLKIVGRPGYWLLLFLIPFAGFVFLVITLYDLCKSFGHDVGFLVGLLLLPIVFVPILAFGDARYRGPVH